MELKKITATNWQKAELELALEDPEDCKCCSPVAFLQTPLGSLAVNKWIVPMTYLHTCKFGAVGLESQNGLVSRGP